MWYPMLLTSRSTALLRQKSKHKVIKSENNRALVLSIHSGDSRSRSVTNAHISARKHTDCAADACILSCAQGPPIPTHIPFPHSGTVKTARNEHEGPFNSVGELFPYIHVEIIQANVSSTDPHKDIPEGVYQSPEGLT